MDEIKRYYSTTGRLKTSISNYIFGYGIKGQRWGIVPSGEITDPELLRLLDKLDDRDYVEIISDDNIAIIESKGGTL